jgi:hypothetical protein
VPVPAVAPPAAVEAPDTPEPAGEPPDPPEWRPSAAQLGLPELPELPRMPPRRRRKTWSTVKVGVPIAVLNASLANFLDAFSYEGATRALGRAGEVFQRMSRLILPLRNRLSMRSNTLSMRGWGGGRLASNDESKGRRPDSERQ